jgi:hypothetical protein
MTGLSIRGYARHREVSHTAVQKAIAAGRIPLEQDGTIDPAKADAAWGKNTNPAKGGAARARRKPAAGVGKAKPKRATMKPVPEAAVHAVRETLREGGAPGLATAGGMTFLQARTANEVIKAQTGRLRLQKLKGELVDRAKAASHVFTLARRERDAWLGWPARVAALMAADLGTDAHTMQTILEQHVRQHLKSLAEVRVDLR